MHSDYARALGLPIDKEQAEQTPRQRLWRNFQKHGAAHPPSLCGTFLSRRKKDAEQKALLLGERSGANHPNGQSFSIRAEQTSRLENQQRVSGAKHCEEVDIERLTCAGLELSGVSTTDQMRDAWAASTSVIVNRSKDSRSDGGASQ